MEQMPLVLGAAFSALCAGAGAWYGLHMARRTAALHKGVHHNADGYRVSAERRRRIIVDEATRAASEQFEAERIRIEEETAVALALQEDYESDLNEKQSELDVRANALTSHEQTLEERRAAGILLHEKAGEVLSGLEEQNEKFVDALTAKTNTRREEWEAGIREEVLSAEKLGISRWMLESHEEMKAEARRHARDVLSSVYVRYNPTFVWPKIPFSVETPSKAVAERAFADGSPLLALLIEGTETAVELLQSNDPKEPPTAKISGGAGVDKEIIRLSLDEILSRNVQNPDKIRAVISKHRKHVDRFILKLGEEAVKILGLPAPHPEILRLIGSLNYRTSHRQNQYFHSLEVARLAGMLADEVGVDPALAKRSGILHDIGKVLDWKIEGSHAVISGDYATRFGEEEIVVDTVLSHHDDKVVETPHAYILKAADAMSGARPGARVDMEEGFQIRIQNINDVVTSFSGRGVTSTAIMHAGREVHVFVDNRRVRQDGMDTLAADICTKLQSDVEFPGQIRVTLVRRVEVSEVA